MRRNEERQTLWRGYLHRPESAGSRGLKSSTVKCRLKQLVFSFKFFLTCQKRHHGQLYLPPGAWICSLRSNTVSSFLPKYDRAKLTGHSTCFESQLPLALRITSPTSLTLVLQRKDQQVQKNSVMQAWPPQIITFLFSFFTQEILLPIFLSKRHNHNPFTKTFTILPVSLMFNFLAWKGMVGLHT